MLYPRMKELREENSITQGVLAEYLHIAQNTYSQYENGSRDVPVEIFIRLADYYGVSVDYLLGRTDNMLTGFWNIPYNMP